MGLNGVAQESYGLTGTDLALAGLIKFHLGKLDVDTAYDKAIMAAETISGRELLIHEAIDSLEISDFDTGTKEMAEYTYKFFKCGGFEMQINEPNEGFLQFLRDCAAALDIKDRMFS